MSDACAPEKLNLLGLERAALEAFAEGLGGKAFRGRQLMGWIYRRGAERFEEMTDLARSFRALLAERAEIRLPEIVSVHRSLDGTIKWLLRADAAQAFEMVFIPEPDRGTLCISSQVGCAMDCSFCSTAQQGFNRNLTTAEIVGQVLLANRELAGARGTGEPLAEALETLERGRQALPMQVNPATSSLYIVNPLRAEGIANLFSTHPPIEDRIARLRAYDRSRGIV